MFKKFGAKLSPKQREEWEEKHTDQGLFDLREQTAPASQSLPTSITFSGILYDSAGWEHALFGSPASWWLNAVLVTPDSTRMIAMWACTFYLRS